MDAKKKRRLEQINAELEQNNIELIAYLKAMRRADAASCDAMEAHVDELFRERCRIIGLPEDEIVRIEQESERAVDEQIAVEISIKAAQQ